MDNEKKALDLDELDQVTGGAKVGGNEAYLTGGAGRVDAVSGMLKQVVSNVTGKDALSTQGGGLSAAIEGVQSSDR